MVYTSHKREGQHGFTHPEGCHEGAAYTSIVNARLTTKAAIGAREELNGKINKDSPLAIGTRQYTIYERR